MYFNATVKLLKPFSKVTPRARCCHSTDITLQAKTGEQLLAFWLATCPDKTDHDSPAAGRALTASSESGSGVRSHRAACKRTRPTSLYKPATSCRSCSTPKSTHRLMCFRIPIGPNEVARKAIGTMAPWRTSEGVVPSINKQRTRSLRKEVSTVGEFPRTPFILR